METSAVTLLIQEAFAAVARPAIEDIAPHRCEECDELRDELAPFEVGNIPPSVLRKHVWDLPLLSDSAKHYYLPAWLNAGLAEDDWDFKDAVFQALKSDHRWEPQEGYTTAQWQAVLAWLDCVRQSDDQVTQETAEEVRCHVAAKVAA